MAHAAFYAVLAGNVAPGFVCAYGTAWGVPGPGLVSDMVNGGRP